MSAQDLNLHLQLNTMFPPACSRQAPGTVCSVHWSTSCSAVHSVVSSVKNTSLATFCLLVINTL